ncbi:hypothetical protein [Moorella sulfitireducens (nom. illeg.)]|uniref:hypothetical protein n=1 Tax=Neomoorella sulfitireducens TaxID=2972948 RepID=UPI0021AC67F9|nr:hypothetical protein [Moorella sulfitireducens]
MDSTKILHIRFPVEVVEQLSSFLKNYSANRNRFIVEAVVEKMRREMQVQAFKNTRGILAAEDAPEWVNNPGADWVKKLRSKERTVHSWST